MRMSRWEARVSEAAEPGVWKIVCYVKPMHTYEYNSFVGASLWFQNETDEEENLHLWLLAFGRETVDSKDSKPTAAI